MAERHGGKRRSKVRKKDKVGKRKRKQDMGIRGMRERKRKARNIKRKKYGGGGG